MAAAVARILAVCPWASDLAGILESSPLHEAGAVMTPFSNKDRGQRLCAEHCPSVFVRLRVTHVHY